MHREKETRTAGVNGGKRSHGWWCSRTLLAVSLFYQKRWILVMAQTAITTDFVLASFAQYSLRSPFDLRQFALME